MLRPSGVHLDGECADECRSALARELVRVARKPIGQRHVELVDLRWGIRHDLAGEAGQRFVRS